MNDINARLMLSGIERRQSKFEAALRLFDPFGSDHVGARSSGPRVSDEVTIDIQMDFDARRRICGVDGPSGDVEGIRFVNVTAESRLERAKTEANGKGENEE
jgi:hypothetical protein